MIIVNSTNNGVAKIVFFLIFLSLNALLIHAVSHTITPFFISFVFAYILNPLIDIVSCKFKLRREFVVLCIYTIFISCFILIVSILFPLVYQQIASLIIKFPVYKVYVQNELIPLFTDKIESLDPSIAEKIESSAHSLTNVLFNSAANITNHIWEYTLATINFVTIILLVPVMLYYFLKDWNKLEEAVYDLMPLQERNKIFQIIDSINALLSAYIRGQLNICLVLSIFYIIGLSLIGLDLSILIGIISGFLIIVPFIGALISFILALIACFFMYGFSIKLFYIFILYLVGHIIEGYILTPKIIGSKIGLHPLWIMFAVFACGSIFGFFGIFFAIPIAGILKVLLSYGVTWYKHSQVYKS